MGYPARREEARTVAMDIPLLSLVARGLRMRTDEPPLAVAIAKVEDEAKEVLVGGAASQNRLYPDLPPRLLEHNRAQ